MNITRKQDGATLTIALDDRLDTLTMPQLEAELQEGLDGIENLIFDFSELEYITSAGLRVLVNAQRKIYGRGRVTVIHANNEVRNVFELTGLDDMLGEA